MNIDKEIEEIFKRNDYSEEVDVGIGNIKREVWDIKTLKAEIKALVEKSVEEERKQNIELLRYVKSKQGKEQHWFDVGEEAGYKRGKRGVEEYKAKVDIDLSITILKEYLKKEVLAPNGKADIKEALRLLELSKGGK